MVVTFAFAEETAEEAPTPAFVDAVIVTKVLDEGQVVAGVRLEWDLEFAAGALTTSSFAVNGYTIIGLYVNNDGAWKHAETSGKYVFLEFEDPVGIGTGTHNTLQYKDGHNLLRDLTIDVQSLYDMNLYAAKGYIHYEVDDYLTAVETNNDYATPLQTLRARRLGRPVAAPGYLVARRRRAWRQQHCPGRGQSRRAELLGRRGAGGASLLRACPAGAGHRLG